MAFFINRNVVTLLTVGPMLFTLASTEHSYLILLSNAPRTNNEDVTYIHIIRSWGLETLKNTLFKCALRLPLVVARGDCKVYYLE